MKTKAAAGHKKAFIRFNLYTWVNEKGSVVNKCPNRVKRGYPVGCAIPSVVQTAANSPLSMNQTVGASVFKYRAIETRNTNNPMIRTIFLLVINL
jgi:hypothetical protein